MSAIDPGHAMDLGKTPMAGFSNGTREFGVFNIAKPQGCTKDADCSNGLTCDTTLGYFGSRYSQEENVTIGCREGTPGCASDTMVDAAYKPVPASGFCIDQTSPLRGGPVSNLLSAIGFRVLIGVRDTATPKKYGDIYDWLTNKFMNVTVRTVEAFDPGKRGAGLPAGAGRGGNRRLFFWGRPGFIGVAKNGRSLPMYFAYADMPAEPARVEVQLLHRQRERCRPVQSARERCSAGRPGRQPHGVQPEELTTSRTRCASPGSSR